MRLNPDTVERAAGAAVVTLVYFAIALLSGCAAIMWRLV